MVPEVRFATMRHRFSRALGPAHQPSALALAGQLLPAWSRAGFADPHHMTALGAGRVFIEDKFDQLTTAKRSAKRYGNFSLGEVT